MTCEQCRQLLHGYVDDELDLATTLEIEKHLPECRDCRNRIEATRAVRSTASQPTLYHPAPPMLRERLAEAIRSEMKAVSLPEAKPIIWWKRPAVFSSIAAGICLIIGSIVLLFPTHAPPERIDALIDSHVRSLLADHLLDVASTDQHTVKPWFTGKIDFSPPVVDLSAEGFPLIGGRLDYLNQQKLAVLVYRRNKHTINLFISPGIGPSEMDSRRGFNLIAFECKGMACWAVSDMNSAELQQFVDLFKVQRPASTRF